MIHTSTSEAYEKVYEKKEQPTLYGCSELVCIILETKNRFRNAKDRRICLANTNTAS